VSPESQPAGRWRSGVAGAALTVLLGLFFLPHPFGQGLANLSFDLPFRFRPNVPVDSIVIIYMDEASTKALTQPWDSGAWDRREHARLLDRLRACGAKAVVFDILFDLPSTNGTVDEVFLRAIQAARQDGIPVLVGGQAETTMTGHYQMTNEIRPFAALEKLCAWGLAELGDIGAIRRQHFAGTERVPSLAWRTAELTLPSVPSAPATERWIHYYGPPGFLPKRSYAQALDPRLTGTNTFAGKVCFVGAWPGTPFAGGIRSDEWHTPYSRWGGGESPGVELTATVYLNLARHDFLRRMSGLDELLLVVLAGSVFGFVLALCRPTLAVGLGVLSAVAVAMAACGLMWHQHVWLSWLVISGVEMPGAIAWSALTYTKRLAREKSLLEMKLATASHRTEPAPALPSDTVTAIARPAGAIAAAPTPMIPDHTILRRIGKGAYGEVWLARNEIGLYHAAKIVRREDFDANEPFEREYHGIQKFMPISRSHPGLVLILHVGRREGFVYYIMEAADDEITGPQISPETYSPKNLAREIRRRGHLPAAECLQVGLDLTAALEFLHGQRLIHRDIKPANIIFIKNRPKFADIGLVTEIAATGGDVTYLGTKGYIAPEGPGTPSADIYSLGKVLYEASTGLGCEQFPELPSTLLQRPDQTLSIQLNAILLKACRQELSQRYQNATTLRADLLRLRDTAGVQNPTSFEV